MRICLVLEGCYPYVHGGVSTWMHSYITAMFLCDSCDEDAKKALKRCKLYKSFRMSYWGWMDFHTGLVVLPEEAVIQGCRGQQG